MAAGIIVGSVGVSVVPSAQTWNTELRKQVLPGAARVGDEVGRAMGQRIASRLREFIPRGLAEATKTAGAQGGKAGGAFARDFQARIRAAFANLPEPKIGADATQLDAELASIRARLAALGDKKIGIDIGAKEALAELTMLRARLTELGARSPNIQVTVDTGRAAAELAAFEAEVAAVDANDINVDAHVDDHGSIGGVTSSMGGLLLTGLALGPALIPVGAAIAASFAGIVAAVAAAGAAVGVLVLAILPVVKALQAMSAAHQQSSRSAVSSASAIVSAQEQVKSSQAGLAEAQANADDAAIRSAEAVANARRSLADAQRSASQSVARALESQRQAEASLRQAQQQALDAQRALTQARADARRQLEDLALAVEDSALAQRQSVLDVQTALDNLNQTLSDGTATALQKQQATLAYETAVQQLKDQTVRNKRLGDEKAAADKKGVEGSAQVTAAQHALLAANQRLIDSQRRLGTASAAVDEARRAGAESVAKAGQALTDAIRAQAIQQRQSAFSVAQAERAVASSLRAVKTASEQAAGAGSAAMTKLQTAMAGLTPAGRSFVTFLYGLKPVLSQFSAAAQTGFLPGLQAGMKAMLPLVPALTQFIGALARVMGGLAKSAGEALAGPWWRSFFSYVGGAGVRTLKQMGQIIGNLAVGFAGLLRAFDPVINAIGQGLVRLTGRFANFGRGVNSSNSFVRYIMRVGPLVVSTFASIGRAVGHVIVALAPIGTVVLRVLRSLSDAISKLDPRIIRAVAIGLVAVGAGMFAINKVSSVVGVISKLGPALSFLAANPIILGIAALAAGFVLLYTKSKSFHDFINNSVVPLFRGVFTAVFGAVRKIIDNVRSAIEQNRPQLEQLLHAFEKVAGFLLKILVPVFKFAIIHQLKLIGHSITIAITVIGWLVRAFNGVAGVAKAVWGAISGAVSTSISVVRRIIGSALNWLTRAWSTGWNAVSRTVSTVFGAIRSAIGSAISWIRGKIDWLVKFFTGLPGRVRNAFVGMFDGLKSAFKSAINFVIDGLNALKFTIGGWKVGKGWAHITIPKVTVDFIPGKIPHMAKGGHILEDGSVLVGDAGPEILNLPSGAKVTPLTPADRAGFGQSGVRDVHFHGYGFVGSPQTLGKEVAGWLARWQMSGGELPVGVR